MELLVAVLIAFGHCCATINAQPTYMNVTNYGAVGDAVQFIANATSNSVIVTTTNQLSSADIGKEIELFGAGELGTSTNHQDLLANIVNVVNGTNIYISTPAGATTNGCTGIYGSNNREAFQKCVNAAPSNSVINIPDGTYLFIGPSNHVDFAMTKNWIDDPSVVISKGGLTFLGQSETNTILLGCGAWQNKGPYALRGYMFKFVGPVQNPGPVIFDSMTVDGGVLVGDTQTQGNQGPASTATGDGWDFTHRAFEDFTSTPFFNNRIFRNIHVRRWRGEQFYSQIPWDSSLPTQALLFTNCIFSEGDATALNLAEGHIVDHCVFSNLDEVSEFYVAYSTHPSLFQYCLVTNMYGAVMAFNGALTNSMNPPYTVLSNTFYITGQNGIQTTPAQNLFISNNTFIGNGAGNGITIGVSGYQGTAPNSNIVISGNLFTNVYFPISILGSGMNAAYDVQIISNKAILGNSFAYGGGWGTNILFVGNVITNFYYGLNSTKLVGQWYIDGGSNQCPPYSQSDGKGVTNVVSYTYGMLHQIAATVPNSVWVLDDTHPQQIPPGAIMQITTAGTRPAPLFASASMTGSPIAFQSGQTTTYMWKAGHWQVVVNPPTNLRIIQ